MIHCRSISDNPCPHPRRNGWRIRFFLIHRKSIKLKSIPIRLGAVHAALLAISTIQSTRASISVDGVLDVGFEPEYAAAAVQATEAGWGASNVLANIHAGQDGSKLGLFVSGVASNNAILLFIDSKAGGLNFIPNNLISSGGEEYTINNLGTSDTAGMTFEAGFNPDYAIRIYGNADINEAHVNRYDLQAHTRNYVGQTRGPVVTNSGFISEIRTVWNPISPPYADAVTGVEMKLSLAALGVPSGSGQTVKVMALLVNGGSDYASNQVLGSRTSAITDIGGGIKTINFETETGTQTISFTVDNLDTDGDLDPDISDPDDDNDGLLDVVETGDGNYLSETQTGTNPLIEDTDGDGYGDGDEVAGFLGYVSNPNIPNYATMAVPGSYTTPTWKEDGSAGNAMAQVGTDLTGQYQWLLNYNFRTLGNIQYKFAANGTWTNSWGNNGQNVNATIQASGFHTFSFNNTTLAYSLARTTYPDAAAFLSAYGLSAGVDDDNDGVMNEAEFTANTDPTEDDTDGDGALDGADVNPLQATRDIVFSVNMNVQEALGNFNPVTGGVSVKFFSGIMNGQPDLALTDLDDDGIYTGTLSNIAGPVGSAFGNYKFFNTTAGAPNSGYEDGFDRGFDLGAANTAQTLATVFFSNNSNLPGSYGSWAATNAGGQAADLDFDGDGVANGLEYFMGETGSSFTANPQPDSSRVVSWPRDPAATGVSFKVWSSTNLATWTDVTAGADTSDPDFVKYTIPASTAPIFVRLSVSNP
jgi:hypothetical protein